MKRFTLALMAMLAFSFSVKAQVYVSTTPANRNVILEEFTGRTCTWCPSGHVIANQIKAQNPNRFWSVNIHSEGFFSTTTYPNLNTSKGNQIRAAFGATSFPSGVVNRSTSSAVGRDQWTSSSNSQFSQAAECNVAGMAIVDPITRLATITVEVYYTGNSSVDENYLTVCMVQDSIWGSQTGGSDNPSQWIGGQYCHMHVFRDIVTDVMGDAISPTTQGTLITRTYEYQVPQTIGTPNGVEVDLNNIHFIAWVSEKYQGTPTRPILNANELEYIQGVDEPIYPIVTGVEIDGLYECTLSKNIKISLQNIGTGVITSMSITAEYDGETYNEYWEGDLQPYGKEIIMIPVMASFGTQDVVVSITEANGEPYEFTSTASVNILEWSDLEIEGEQETLKLLLMQDKFGNQITWKFTAADGTVLASGGPYDVLAGNSSTQIHAESVVVPVDECVKFTIRDSMGDGICCTYGNGYYIVRDSHNRTLFGDNSNGDFGAEASHLLSVKGTSVNVNEKEQTVKIYPNPSMGALNIEGEDMVSVEVYNTVGQLVMMREVGGNAVQLNTEGLVNGLYIVRIYAIDGTVANHTFSVAR